MGNQFLYLPYFFVSDDGLIDQPDLREVMRACMVENGMHFDEKEVSDLANALFDDAVKVCVIILNMQMYKTKWNIILSSSGFYFHINIIVFQEGCSGITVDDLKDQLQRHEGLLENLTISIGNLDNFSCKNTFFKLLLQPTCIQIIALLVRTRAAEIVVE